MQEAGERDYVDAWWVHERRARSSMPHSGWSVSDGDCFCHNNMMMTSTLLVASLTSGDGCGHSEVGCSHSGVGRGHSGERVFNHWVVVKKVITSYYLYQIFRYSSIVY